MNLAEEEAFKQPTLESRIQSNICKRGERVMQHCNEKKRAYVEKWEMGVDQ